MNQFGTLFQVSIFGESHGPMVGITLSGLPAGLALDRADFVTDINRRKGGSQKGTTPRQEEDMPEFVSGWFQGRTTGAPLTMLFKNENTRSGDYQKQRAVPRPGHADWTAHEKFGGFEDYRGGGHFSGRLTVCLVAAGVVAKKLLHGITIQSNIVSVGGQTDIEMGLQRAIDAKDSVGGIVDCRVEGLPAGLGEPFWNSIESLLSHAVFAIPAVRAIEFGTGFAAADMFGVDHNDAIVNLAGKTETNHAGGVVGGISNGNPLYFKIAVKPTSSTPKMQETLNWETGNIESFSVKGRHDLCIALRVPPVLEAVTAIVLLDLMMQQLHIPRIVTEPIYHIATAADWQEAIIRGAYQCSSLSTEGFIHCATEHQVPGVLERYFSGQTNLVKLKINPVKLQAPLKYEGNSTATEKFPHVYGMIPLEAIQQFVEL